MNTVFAARAEFRRKKAEVDEIVLETVCRCSRADKDRTKQVLLIAQHTLVDWQDETIDWLTSLSDEMRGTRMAMEERLLWHDFIIYGFESTISEVSRHFETLRALEHD